MTETKSSDRSGRRLLGWWPVVAILALAVVAQRAVAGGYDATGHAAGHLASGLMVFMMAAFVAIVLWAAPTTRRSWAVGLASVVLVAGWAVVLAGNLRVVDAVGDRNWSDDQAGALGAAVPGFDSGHSLSGQGSLVAVVGSIGFIWVVRSRRAIPLGLAIGATVASVIFPYWILPGAGLLVLAIGVVVRRARDLTEAAADPPATLAEVG